MRKSALLTFGLVVTALVALGLVVLFSASQENAARLYGKPYHFVIRQAGYVVAGILLATLLAVSDYRLWKNHGALVWFFFAVVFVALLLVFPPFGRMIKGSYRWINLGPVNIQPSEFAKLAIVIVLAKWLDDAGWRVELFMRGSFYPLLIVAALAAPVLFEPDFGSVMVIGAVSVVLMVVAGTRLLHLGPPALLGIGIVAAKVLANRNRMARIAAWLGMKLDAGAQVADAAAERAAYQAKMALVAIKNGALKGVGLGESMQKMYYLPEAHTDFIFAIGAEEMGLGFSLGVIVLFAIFFALCVYIARKASDRFGRLLVVGMGFLVFFQAMFNLGVVCGALPTKGMALPFFSYGGTNMLSAFFAVGTILSVGIHSYRDQKRVVKRSVFV